MSDWYIRQHKPPQIPKRAVWSERAKAVRTMLQDWPLPARPAMLILLVVLLASVMGCSTTSPLPENAARNPSPPAVSTPQPSKPYLDSVSDDLKKWREMLTGTRPTP